MSPNFIANGGWTKLEFETIDQREIYEKNNFLLPIWHGVSKDDVYEYSPQLTNRLAAIWSDGVDKVVPMILRALGRA